MDIKINQVTPTQQMDNQLKMDGNRPDNFKFTLLSKIEENQLQARLQQLMQDIQVQGQKIADHMDIRDMRQYRVLITEFLNEVVYRSHKFTRENFLDRRGRHRVYGIVRQVNTHLDELAKALLSSEKKPLDILGKLDEIRGLLLDIFA